MCGALLAAALAADCATAAGAADGKPAQFKTLGAMIDVSRGRVLTVPYLKTRFARMGKMGYNAVMLYTEELDEAMMPFGATQRGVIRW